MQEALVAPPSLQYNYFVYLCKKINDDIGTQCYWFSN